jgi:hypothetical protein
MLAGKREKSKLQFPIVLPMCHRANLYEEKFFLDEGDKILENGGNPLCGVEP